MSRRLASAAAIALLLALAGCLALAAPARLPEAQADGFDLLAFFDGEARSTGTITTALVSTQAFSATFEGRREGNSLRLDERFRFADGSARLQRWRLTRDGGGRLRGTVETEDETGALRPPVPVEGRLTAEGAVLAYDGYAPGGGTLRLGFRHAMTRLDGRRVSNHVTVRLLGLPLATSDVVFVRDGANPHLMR
ncbi:DUF3833 family protein [Antarcticirhabdus aurantiaca]|uniref:DUF3833 family protein n=1 Tax=Antarcticirhabdus aurantiaca TaxID=2606717 RepID=A0ACD4NJM0_9HYPH|nr:DUF3833 family protein [Antarcticirhabdus aurantiaca]WAJ26968.1 DUF3833 family protein [Jeongeuplla avenae]